MQRCCPPAVCILTYTNYSFATERRSHCVAVLFTKSENPTRQWVARSDPSYRETTPRGFPIPPTVVGGSFKSFLHKARLDFLRYCAEDKVDERVPMTLNR